MTLSNSGYEDLRTYVENNWSFIGLFDNTDTELIRIDVPNDSRASFSSDSGSNPLRATITLTGEDLFDEGVTLPVTLDHTEVFKTDSTSQEMGSDPVKPATIEAQGDEIIIDHEYSIPP